MIKQLYIIIFQLLLEELERALEYPCAAGRIESRGKGAAVGVAERAAERRDHPSAAGGSATARPGA